MIYFDHAATSYPKPKSVRREMIRCLCQYGGNPGRGAHALSLAAAEKVYECRERAAAFFGVAEPERVFFTMNTTQGLNTVLKGLLHSGDHVLLSDLEHNAVWRPLYKMAKDGKIEMDIFPSYVKRFQNSAREICEGISARIRPNTRLLVCTAASNICSAFLPIAEIAALCRRHGIFCVVDGAQGGGHRPISVDGMGLDALCLPGHKGLLGAQGCGMVLLGKGVRPEVLCEGGNGLYSLEGEMGDLLPERYEAGTLPTPAIAALCEGLKHLEEMGLEAVAAHERTLYRRSRELLGNTRGVTLYVPHHEGAVLLFSVRGMPSEEVAKRLDEKGICVRGGFHCAALAHQTLGTPSDGAVRVSFGLGNRLSDTEALWRVLSELTRNG